MCVCRYIGQAEREKFFPGQGLKFYFENGVSILTIGIAYSTVTTGRGCAQTSVHDRLKSAAEKRGWSRPGALKVRVKSHAEKQWDKLWEKLWEIEMGTCRPVDLRQRNVVSLSRLLSDVTNEITWFNLCFVTSQLWLSLDWVADCLDCSRAVSDAYN